MFDHTKTFLHPRTTISVSAWMDLCWRSNADKCSASEPITIDTVRAALTLFASLRNAGCPVFIMTANVGTPG
jgi:hypothetical protein